MLTILEWSLVTFSWIFFVKEADFWAISELGIEAITEMLNEFGNVVCSVLKIDREEMVKDLNVLPDIAAENPQLTCLCRHYKLQFTEVAKLRTAVPNCSAAL